MSLNKAPASPGVKGEHQDADRCLRAVGKPLWAPAGFFLWS